jgi:hypothetical protein
MLVYVSRRQDLSQQKNVLALAVADFTICVFVMPYRIIYELKAIEDDILCRSMEFFSHSTITFSNIILSVICIERFIKVWYPAKFISERRTVLLILVALGVSVVICTPVPAVFMVIPGNSTDAPQFCQFSSRTVGNIGTTIFSVVLFLINVVYLGVPIILYSLIYFRLYKNKKDLAKHYKSKSLRTRIINVKPIQLSALTIGETAHRAEEPAANYTLNSEQTNRDHKTGIEDVEKHENDRSIDITTDNTRGQVHQTKRVASVKSKTTTMLFICTFIYMVTWITYFLDMFLNTNILSLRYLYFFSHASNPIVYGIVNDKIRKLTKQLFCRQNVVN